MIVKILNEVCSCVDIVIDIGRVFKLDLVCFFLVKLLLDLPLFFLSEWYFWSSSDLLELLVKCIFKVNCLLLLELVLHWRDFEDRLV